eukprot:2642546-Amphidinium_carterae.1
MPNIVETMPQANKQLRTVINSNNELAVMTCHNGMPQMTMLYNNKPEMWDETKGYAADVTAFTAGVPFLGNEG